MPTADDYEDSMISTLAVSDPQLDTGLGTPIRKIITAVALELGGLSDDVDVNTTLYSLDSLTGSDLDSFVGLFGFARQEARNATGTVVVTREDGDAELEVSYGAQFSKPATTVQDEVRFESTSYYDMEEAVLRIEVSVRAVEAGADGNVPANTVTSFPGGGIGYVSCTNPLPITGGRDAEDDAELRQRFLLTVFRNVSGTRDQYMALALAHANVGRAAVIGRESRYGETVPVRDDAVLDSDGRELRRKGGTGPLLHEGDDGWDDPDSETVMAGRFWCELTREYLDHDVALFLDPQNRFWVTVQDTDELLPMATCEMSSETRIDFLTRAAREPVSSLGSDDGFQLSHGNVRWGTVVVSASSEDDGDDDSGETVYAEWKDYTVDYANGVVYPVEGGALDGNGIGDSVVEYEWSFVGGSDFVLVEFDYLSKLNRGGLKTVELYVDGVGPEQVADLQYLDFSKVIDSEVAGMWRRSDGTAPSEGDLYIPLAYQPLVESIGQASIGTSTLLEEGVDFRMLYGEDVPHGVASTHGIDAIELVGKLVEVRDDQDESTKPRTVFRFAGGFEAKDMAPMEIPYYYNETLSEVQSLVDQQSVVTMDVLVHQCRRRYFGIYLSVMCSVFPRQNVVDSVEDAVSDWANGLPFGATMQFSDIETVVANLSGVDNVRVATRGDANGRRCVWDSTVGAYGIVECERDGETFRVQHLNDVHLYPDEVPVVQFVTVYPKTQTDWAPTTYV